jgi:hypothetical protein
MGDYWKDTSGLYSIQQEINKLDQENSRLKAGVGPGGSFKPDDPLWVAYGIKNNLDANNRVQENEAKINQLRQQYDAIANPKVDTKYSVNLNQNVRTWIDNYLSGNTTNADGTKGIPISKDSNFDKLMSVVRNSINEPGYTDFDNPYSADVLEKFIASLEDPYNLKKQNILESMSARGLSGSGISQENLGRLAADYNQSKNVETGNLTSDYYKNQVAKINQDYQNELTKYITSLEGEFKASNQTADAYYTANQNTINAKLNEIANRYNTMYDQTKLQFGEDTQKYFDSMNANANLIGSVGSLAGSYIGSNYSSNNNNYSGNQTKTNAQQFDPWESYNSNPYNKAVQRQFGNTIGSELNQYWR